MIKIRYIFVFLLLVAFACVWSTGGRSVHQKRTAYLNIVTTGDTAQVMYFAPSSALDSFIYMDTFFTSGADSTTIKWVSPLQGMLFTLAGNTGNLTKLDTVGIGTVGCTASFASQDVGISYALSTGVDSTMATAIDSIVDIWNKKASLKDSIQAQDSGTYIKLVSKFGQETFTERWTILMSSDSTDTSSSITTTLMVCDSVVATVNANATVSAVATAAKSGDTAWTITSDDIGLPLVFYFGDTATDTSTIQANVTSWSAVTCTLLINDIVSEDKDFAGIYGVITIDTSATTDKQGFGLSDSVYIGLYGGFSFHGDSTEYTLIAKDSLDSLPYNFRIASLVTTANDTIFKEALYLIYTITDSASDTTMRVDYDVYIDYLLFEQ